MTNKTEINMADVLKDAISKPGIIHSCYKTFHNYSTGNQLLAMSQLLGRGLPLSPIGTFKFWQEKGRNVKKGEKAIALLVPVKISKKDEQGEKTDESFMLFKAVNRFFSLSQTEGEDYSLDHVTAWNKEKALAALDIKEIAYDSINGNSQGYAIDRNIAINPMAALPHKTLFHEIAHVLLGHTDLTAHDAFHTPKNIKEVEAESVALICCESLGLEGAQFSRGYIQNWLGGNQDIPEKSAKKIFSAADKILKAGTKNE
jgi:antirestriction protein ArdC